MFIKFENKNDFIYSYPWYLFTLKDIIYSFTDKQVVNWNYEEVVTSFEIIFAYSSSSRDGKLNHGARCRRAELEQQVTIVVTRWTGTNGRSGDWSVSTREEIRPSNRASRFPPEYLPPR